MYVYDQLTWYEADIYVYERMYACATSSKLLASLAVLDAGIYISLWKVSAVCLSVCDYGQTGTYQATKAANLPYQPVHVEIAS